MRKRCARGSAPPMASYMPSMVRLARSAMPCVEIWIPAACGFGQACLERLDRLRFARRGHHAVNQALRSVFKDPGGFPRLRVAHDHTARRSRGLLGDTRQLESHGIRQSRMAIVAADPDG